MRLAVLLTTLVATATVLVPGAAAEHRPGHPVTGAEEDLGYPIAGRVLSQDQSQGVDAQGRPQAYWVTAGNDETPAMFQVTDIRSGEVVFGERLPAGVHSWASTFSTAEGAVYFGMTSGELYRWRPGDPAVTALGPPVAGEGIWRLAAAPDGVIYGGTYPGGKLIAYDPATGEVTDHGQVLPGETYGRSLVVTDEHVYFGTQPNARLARVDRATGAVTQIHLPEEYAVHEVVYDMTLARDQLFVRVQPSNDLLVYDTTTAEFVDIVPGISGRAISPLDPEGEHVYFRIAAHGIVRYHLDTHTWEPIGWGPNAFPGTWAWIDLDDPDFPGESLAMTYYYGRIYVWNPTTGATRYIGESDLEGAPSPVQALGRGPDGAIYVGAFLSPPGMARFDPATDTTTVLPSAGQVEGFGTYDGRLVYGRYPHGHLLDYDLDQPWDYGTNPGPAVELGAEQDRPQAFVQVGDRMAVGSVPVSGRLGGALSLWDPATGEVTVHRDVVPDQSVVSLATHRGLLYGGTSVYGGYGIDPVATEAKLFVFDPDTGQVVSEVTPVPGSKAISALTVDRRGWIWGLADRTLFVYHPRANRVIRSAELFGGGSTRYGTERGLILRGRSAYVATAGSLWHVDTRTWRATELADGGVAHLATDDDGRLYFARGARLYRWTEMPGG
ncbi:MAG TPA: hypothetical protein VHH15_11875 [Actinophytocola sp.]|nr:hypothetical protein [Actinophytocola sp.]